MCLLKVVDVVLQVVCTAQQGQGLEILAAFVMRNGALFLDVDVRTFLPSWFLSLGFGPIDCLASGTEQEVEKEANERVFDCF